VKSLSLNLRSSSRKRQHSKVLLLFLLCSIPGFGWADKTYSASGLVLQVDTVHPSVVVSCREIPGYMEPMVMPFPVRDPKELGGLQPGTAIEFTLVVGQDSIYVENVRIRAYQTSEQDPSTARRLKLLNGIYDSKVPNPLEIGQRVPAFSLIDQSRQPVMLSQFRGKVVAINFVYTRCPLPNYCFRLSNNFGILQRRFKARMGKDLVFLTITFDPEHDTPEALTRYARIWNADLRGWHFLTGQTAEVKRICREFGVDFFPDEDLMAHSLHTAVIDRTGELAANLEGNQFSADQLGDLVQTILDRKNVN
jgi:protein SCO1